jgi:hypothetical protein
MIATIHPAALLLALCALAAPAQAQTVYRCGESYSNQPCPGATAIAVDDPRSAAQRAQTDAATQRDARSAQLLETERLRQEGKPAPATILASPAKPAPAAADKKLAGAKPKKPAHFTAASPRKPGETSAAKKKKKKKKAADA